MRLINSFFLVVTHAYCLIKRVTGFQLTPGRWRSNGVLRPSTTLLERTPGKGFGSKMKANGPLADLSEERKANLFQALLRDLQIEGVPLLGVDATQVHTLQAAVWTTLSELCDSPIAQKACLVFEYIPISALQPFVDDFMILKTQTEKTMHLAEIHRVSLSMVGKGAGPAILIEIANATDRSQHERSDTFSHTDNEKCTSAMKAFIKRVVIGESACPHVDSTEHAPSNLANVTPQRIEYKVCQKLDAFHVLSSFWNSVCELSACTEIATLVLALPSVGTSQSNSVESNHARFVNVAELLSRYLCLYKGDGVYELLHFHPNYTRDWINPRDRPAHGHLPPTSWLAPMLRRNGNDDAASRLTKDEYECSNFQRRSPVPAVCIKRVEQLEHATDGASGIIQLKLDDGSTASASGVPTYARNTMRLASAGQEALQKALDLDRALLNTYPQANETVTED
ncbi:hypothetical protein MPSEU_000653200 [Mayamaea pseudoterrestris]|nr:hypothetical protein MPSEU_000653200 [Mayamaea pseudoterrestris]